MPDDGVPMEPGSSSEPQGPEDALGAGLKRGDYSGRQDGAQHFEGGVEQNPNVEEVGDTKGKKGGVDSQTQKEREEEEAEGA